MIVKDYYKILQIEPGADRMTIKKAFRKLAMEYHPDKQPTGQPYDSYYKEIQEAYETLHDPQKREAYLYQRWLQGALGNTLDNALTAEQILQLFIKAEQSISATDPFRTHKKILAVQLLGLYSESRLQTVLQHPDKKLQATVVKGALQSASQLDSEGTQGLMERFHPLLELDPAWKQQWLNLIEKAKEGERNARLKIPLLILITLLICLLFWLIRR